MKQLRICVRYELRKLLLGAKGWLVILAALVLQIVLCLTAKPRLPSEFDPALYRQTLAAYAGTYSPETEQRIRLALEGAQTRIETYSKRPVGGSDGDLIERARQLSFAQEDAAVLQALTEKYTSLRENQAALTYDLELTDYLRRFGLSWPSLLCIALLMPVLMLRDAACGMAEMLDACPIGRRQRTRAKLLTAAVLSAGLTLVCTAMQLVLFAVRWDLGSLTVPLQSLTGYENCGLHCSVLAGLLLGGAVRVLAAVAAAWLLCLLAVWLRKDIAAVAVFALLLGSSALPLLHGFGLAGALSGLSGLCETAPAGLAVLVGLLAARLLLIGGLFRCK